MMSQKTLKQIVAEHPFHDYAKWWEVGHEFVCFMSEAIVSQWSQLPHNDGELGAVRNYVGEYLKVVFDRQTKPSLVDEFIAQSFSMTVQSGEFDALSYAFYRSAFELIDGHITAYENSLERERRRFTQRVGKIFFNQVRDFLDLALPSALENEGDFKQLKNCIQQVGAFFKKQRYVRDSFDFRFSLDVEKGSGRIVQIDVDFLDNLKRDGIAYAIYEMGFPIILPSAVYLFHTLGEAQHHSSRTIEELYALVGYEARETDDFDPTDYPSDSVVELWEIRALPKSK